jgi:Rrf2 family iron-sulfur cluster assembly transcriptional regulator
MLYSVATGYALQALAALPEDGSFYLAKDLASFLGLPPPFLAKVLQNLARHGLLESVRGPKGGFRLAKPAHRITVEEVVHALEGRNALERCVMGFAACDPDHPCPLHEAWLSLRSQVELTLSKVTVRDLQLTQMRRGRDEHGGVQLRHHGVN